METKADWLRSEIKRLEEREEELCVEVRRRELANEDCEHTRTRIYEVRKIRDDMITRYTEELLELNSK